MGWILSLLCLCPGKGTILITRFLVFFVVVCCTFSGLIVAISSISSNVFYSLLMFLVSGVLISYAGLSFLLLLKVRTPAPSSHSVLMTHD